MIYVVPVEGLFGYDVIKSLEYAKFYYQFDLNAMGNFDITSSIDKWPGLSFLAVSISKIINVDLFYIAKYIPSVISSVGIIFIFLLSRKISTSTQTALLSTFASLAVYQYVEFHSWFVRETVGFVYFFIFIYLVMDKMVLKQRIQISILYIILLGAIIITHHFISLLVIIYLLLSTICQLIYNKLMHQTINLSNILLIAIASVLSYWMYVGSMPFILLGEFIKDILIQSLNFQISNDLGGIYYEYNWSLRRFLIKNGNLFFVIFFGFFSLISLYVRSNKIKVVLFTYISCLFALFVISFILPNYILIIPNRIYMYAWPFVFLVSFDLHEIISKKYKSIVLIIVLIFIIFNIWTIPPYIYSDNNHPEYEFNQLDYRHSNQQYLSIYWMKQSYVLQSNDIIIGSSTAKELIEPMLNVKVISDPELFQEGKITTSFKMLYFDTELFEIVRTSRNILPYKVSYDSYNKLNNNTHLIKNYDNQKIEIYTTS